MNLYKALSGYSLMSIIQAMLTFLSISFFSHYMKIDIFGQYNLYLTIIPFVLNFLLLGLPSSISVFYHKVPLDMFKVYMGQIIFYILPISFIIGILIYFSFSQLIENYFLLESRVLFIIVLLTFFQILPQVMLAYLQTSNQLKNYIYLNSSYLLINLLVTIGAFLLFKELFFLFLSLLIVSIIFSFIIFIYLYKLQLFEFKYNKQVFLELLYYGLPLILHTMGISLLFMSDRFFISKFLGNVEVAYYSVSLQLSLIILIFVNSFSSAWGVYLFSKLKDYSSHVDKSIMRPIYIFVVVFLLLPFLIYYVQVVIFNIFFPVQYKEALKYILFINLGYSIMGIWKIFVGFLHFSKKTKLISFITLFALIINLILNYYFVNLYETMGVVYGTLISMILLCIMTIYVAGKEYKFYTHPLEL